MDTPNSRSKPLSAHLLYAVLALLAASCGRPTATPPPTAEPTTRPTATTAPTATPTPSPTATPDPVPTPLDLPSAPVLGDTWLRLTDGMLMVYAPAGTFWMGSPEDDPLTQDDELPRHRVTLDGFWIDQTEVTNSRFARCVAAGVCSAPFPPFLEAYSDYYGNRQYDSYPVVNVSWVQAEAYCAWVGGTLSSEAQWEYAARGPDSLTYPWGNSPPDDTRASAGHNVGHPTRVGSYPAGASWCGALDMAGNVWEWTTDWYGPYPTEAQTNPVGPAQGAAHVLRGGSWFDQVDFSRAANRYALREGMRDYYGPVGHGFNVGFRCVVTP